MTMIRLYYWFRGAPADLAGGPWWYRDFLSERSFWDYAKAIGPVCCQLYRLDGPAPSHDPMKIAPPPGATEVRASSLKS